MIPILEQCEVVQGIAVFTTTDGVRGCVADIELIDIESDDVEIRAERLSLWLRTLSPEVRARFILSVSNGESLDPKLPRALSIQSLGFIQKRLRLVVEDSSRSVTLRKLFSKQNSQTDRVEVIFDAFQSLKNLGFKTEFLSQNQVTELFFQDVAKWVSTVGSIETGTNSIGVVRLHKPSARPISLTALAEAISSLPAPFEVRIGIEKFGSSQAELLLQRKLKQFQSSSSGVAETQAASTEDALIQTSLSGEALLNYELCITCSRPTKELLREALQKIAASLKTLGDVYIETIGTAPSFVAGLSGSSMHVPLLERESALPIFIPIFSVGGSERLPEMPSRTISIHRRDRSLSHIDLLSQSHRNSNALVVGSSGRGKSVFLGTLTHSLLNDPNVRMLKVDVGGSHSRECEMNEGIEFKISIDKSSGLNPFGIIDDGSEDNEFVRSVLGQFLESLLKEEGEIRLTKAIRSEIDNSLNKYLVEHDGEKSLDSFYEFSKSLPRRELLARWCGSGLYANAFRSDGRNQDNRLRYFNFAEVFQAADPEFAQAAMAAVLATFNLEMRLNPEKRLVLVCDETPFFIERCFEFFKFSAANVRKFGASLILVVQLSRHLVVGGDTGVIENCSHRFLLSSDGSKEEFCSRLQMNDSSFDLLSNLSFSSKSFSEILYQNAEASKVLRLYLSREEYWRLTSSQADRLKFKKLMEAVPNLKVEEAIRCLSV